MGKKILIVDDEPDILKVVSYCLSRHGYDVIHATTGQEALGMAANHNPDLILMDYRLPGILGDEVFIKIKADPALNHIPVIFLTANTAFIEEIASLTQTGCYLLQPFSPKELIEKVEHYLVPTSKPS